MRTSPFARSFRGLGRLGWAVLGVLSILFAGSLAAQENRPPSAPGEIAVSEVTVHSARIAWGAAIDQDGDPLVYLVWLRKRVEGVAQPWLPPHETRETQLVWDGLAAATLYEVKVAASDGRMLGPARIRELAFTTLPEAGGNQPPSTPRAMEFAQVAAHSVKIAWATSIDPDGDPITYQVTLRKRIEGEVFDWLPPKSTAALSLVWEGLDAETVYDARVRASDGRSVSHWFLKERAFRTTAEPGAPTRPGEISVSAVTATSALVAWGAASGPAGLTLVYGLQVRARIEGVPQDWRAAAETAALSATADNLRPATLYDVRVRAWAQGVPGAWAIKEEAFRTLASGEVNHPPTRPGPRLEVSGLTPFHARIAWEPSTDLDGDRLKYAVCLRKRVEGVAQPWSAARETPRNEILWTGLTPGTVYEVRVRAWDGKAYSEWLLKELAFRTPAPGERLSSFVRRPDPAIPSAQSSLLVTWPDDGTDGTLETATSIEGWVPCLEIETDGALNRAQVPMSAQAQFFRIRQ